MRLAGAASPLPDVGRSRRLDGARHSRLLVGAVCLAFLLLGLRLLPVGTDNLRLAGLFSTDEQLAGELLRTMIRDGNLGLSHFYSYGPLDLYLARLLLLPDSLAGPVSDRAILVALRLVSLLSGCGCLLLTYQLGRRLWSAAVGALAAALLALSPVLFAWSVTAHPDTPQLLFLLLALWVALPLPLCPNRRALAIASLCAALAFLSKYSGVLLLPLLLLSATVGRLRARDLAGRTSARLRQLVADWAVVGAVFALTFVALDPQALVEPRRFISQARAESELAHTGHLLLSGPSPLRWLLLLAGSDVLGPLTLVAGIGGIAVWFMRDRACLLRFAVLRPSTPAQRDDARYYAAGRAPLALWTLTYLIFLFAWVGDRQARYALPVLPGLTLFAAAAMLSALGRLSRTRGCKQQGDGSGPVRAHANNMLVLLCRSGVTIVVLAATLPPGLQLLHDVQREAARMQKPTIAERIAAGRWLATRFPPDAPLLYDAYAYIPPGFTHAQESFGLTGAQIDGLRPRVIVTDAAIRDRFFDPAAGARYRDGPAAYAAIAATYRALEADAFPGYELLRSFGPVHIYGRLGG